MVTGVWVQILSNHVTILSQYNSFCILTFYLRTILILSSCICLTAPTMIFSITHLSPQGCVCLMTIIIFGDEYKSWNFSLCKFASYQLNKRRQQIQTSPLLPENQIRILFTVSFNTHEICHDEIKIPRRWMCGNCIA